MKLIIGLGNPEEKYARTRHNAGFQVMNAYAKEKGATYQEKDKFKASIAELTVGDEKVLLAKPDTYYNESGQAARVIADFYKLDPTADILVVHDDLALPFGTLRTRERGSDAGNNGIKSMNAHLGHDYHRIRVGIYNELRKQQPDVEFVLGQFPQDEQDQLDSSIIPKTIELIDAFLAGTLEPTSHRLDAE